MVLKEIAELQDKKIEEMSEIISLKTKKDLCRQDIVDLRNEIEKEKKNLTDVKQEKMEAYNKQMKVWNTDIAREETPFPTRTEQLHPHIPTAVTRGPWCPVYPHPWLRK